MDGFEFTVQIIRSRARKKSVCIAVNRGGVRVRIPKTLSEQSVRELIVNRAAWIKQKINEARQTPPVPVKQFINGEPFPYLGKQYKLKIIHRNTPSLKLKRGYFEASVDQSNSDIQSLLIDWYRRHASIHLTAKTERFAKIIGVAPNAVTVKGYRSRWGSCSSSGNISYNWRIILAPHRIIDYVVVHELCHLLEHNHSSRYWQHVERYTPDWRQCRDWLKNNPVGF